MGKFMTRVNALARDIRSQAASADHADVSRFCGMGLEHLENRTLLSAGVVELQVVEDTDEHPAVVVAHLPGMCGCPVVPMERYQRDVVYERLPYDRERGPQFLPDDMRIVMETHPRLGFVLRKVYERGESGDFDQLVSERRFIADSIGFSLRNGVDLESVVELLPHQDVIVSVEARRLEGWYTLKLDGASLAQLDGIHEHLEGASGVQYVGLNYIIEWDPVPRPEPLPIVGPPIVFCPPQPGDTVEESPADAHFDPAFLVGAEPLRDSAASRLTGDAVLKSYSALAMKSSLLSRFDASADSKFAISDVDFRLTDSPFSLSGDSDQNNDDEPKYIL